MRRKKILVILSLFVALQLGLNHAPSFGDYSAEDEQALAGRMNDLGENMEKLPEFNELLEVSKAEKRKLFANVGENASDAIITEDGVIVLV